jgi:hypothetical protein
MKKLLALLPAAALAFATPAHAWSNQLQWRTTTCFITDGNRVIERGNCSAAFAYDTAIRAIKYRWANGREQYFEVGQNASFNRDGVSECLDVSFTDGDLWAFCTSASPDQLGIQGD